MSRLVRVPIETHYYHFDQQGVVFSMWYLAFLEEARNGYLATIECPLRDLLASDHDIQVVHVDIDWVGAVRYGEEVVIDVRAGRVGHTSFALDYVILSEGVERARSRVVYVIVDGQISGKADIPHALRTALEAALVTSSEASAPGESS